MDKFTYHTIDSLEKYKEVPEEYFKLDMYCFNCQNGYQKLEEYKKKSYKNFEKFIKRNDVTIHLIKDNLKNKEQVVTGMVNIKMNIKFMGSIFKNVLGVSGVVSKVTHRNKGLVRKMFTESLKESYENNIDISVLYPFKPSFYEGFGYMRVDTGVACLLDIKEFKKWKIPGEENFEIIEVYETFNEMEEKNDPIYEDFKKIKKEYAKNYDYTSLHTNYLWERLERNGNCFKFIVYESKKPVGYIVFKYSIDSSSLDFNIFKPFVAPRTMNRMLYIREMAWTSTKAKKYLMNFIWRHRDQCKKVIFHINGSENLDSYVTNSNNIHRFSFDSSMLRIINLKSVLEQLDFGVEFDKLTFNVSSDEQCPWNKGVYCVSSVKNEKDNRYISKVNFQTEKLNQEKKYDIEGSIGGITQLLSGFKTVDELQEVEIIQFNQKNTKLIKKLFGTKKNNFLGDMF